MIPNSWEPMGMAEQTPLWHESIEDAIGTAVLALGGFKKVAAMLWPALEASNPDTAYTRLKHCLDPERKDKLSLSELLLIARKAREIGEHSIARYFGRDVGYQFAPLDSEQLERQVRNEKIQWHLSEASRLTQETK